MPKEVFLVELWMKYAERAEEIRVKRLEREGLVKLKARLKRRLYTIRLPPEKADRVLAELKKKERPIVEA